MKDRSPLEQGSAAADDEALAGRRVRLFGRFVSVPAQDTAAAIQRRGGVIDAEHPDLIVVGEDAAVADQQAAASYASRRAAECIGESELWRRLGLLGEVGAVRKLYSPAMLADLIQAPLSVVRRWTRKEVLQPVCWVNRLAFFDFEEIRIGQLLGSLLKQGRSPLFVEAIIDRLKSEFPAHKRPLAELPLTAIDGALRLRSADGFSDTTGQRQFDFESDGSSDSELNESLLPFPAAEPQEPSTTRERAWELGDSGRLSEAVELWRLVMLESPPTAEDHFTLAEWLYAAGESDAALERYYATLELDPEHLEARVCLGCVFAEGGQIELAAAAFQGALQQQPEFADAHYHLARLYQANNEDGAAEPHWRRLLELAPAGPWAHEARRCLGWSDAPSDP